MAPVSGAIFLAVAVMGAVRSVPDLRHIEHPAYNRLRSGITHTKVPNGGARLSKTKACPWENDGRRNLAIRCDPDSPHPGAFNFFPAIPRCRLLE
jgi:hypothetical protein